MTRHEPAVPTTTELMLPKVDRGKQPSSPVPSSERVASHLVLRAARRLELVCWLTICVILVRWVLINIFLGIFTDEFRALYRWLPPVTGLAVSAVVLALSLSKRFSPATLVRLGLVYEVVVCYAIECAAHLGAFQGLLASDLAVDRIGISAVLPWMLFFTVLALFGFGEFSRSGSVRWIVTGAGALTIACLLKLPAIFVGPAIVALLVQHHGWRAFRDPRVWLAGVIPLAITAAWFWRAHVVFERTGLTMGILGAPAKMYPAYVSPGP